MGFPIRPNRDTFGPTFENEWPVANPKKEASADLVNLLCWQVAGLSQVAPLAVITGIVSDSVVTTVYQGLAFDPNGTVSKIPFTYESEGVYSFEFSPTYEDENGNSRNLSLAAGFAVPMNSTPLGMGFVNLLSSNSGEIRFLNGIALPIDPDEFVLQLW